MNLVSNVDLKNGNLGDLLLKKINYGWALDVGGMETGFWFISKHYPTHKGTIELESVIKL